eukprot:CCRYP_011133-RA/>CCRYP_011133-RA protein AED:0.19 eAED:0.19 QI:245/0.75/0.77/1/0.75/0.77/9/246/723
MEASTVLRKSYGSVGGGELRSANNSSPQPIHLHPTLDALDVGPHAFRSSVPQPISQSPETKTLDVSQNRRLQCLSMPATLNSPLLRRNFSSPGDKLKSEKHSTLPQSYDPSLCTPLVREKSPDHRNGNGVENSKEETNKNESFLYYVIYAFVNSIMCLPCLYGYASVIFNHAIYQPHINALSKLVIFSSVIHQCCFTLFSTLPFSIGQVQDAGLIFLSAMSNKIASRILEDPGGDAEDVAEVILSTTIVLLGLATASLGAVLILMGKFRLADVVAYLPLPASLSEYLVLLATFVAIQFLGIDGGIGLGIVVAIFDFVLTTASVSSVSRIRRRSLAFYGPQERAYIENNVYSMQYPKILILEVLSNILDAAGINASIQEKAEISRVNSPLPHHSRMNSIRISESLSPASISPGTRRLNRRQENRKESDKPKPVSVDHHMPRFLVLDLSSVSNVDASAARGCFLQLAKMCAARRIVVCAAGQNGRIDWIMQTHDCANHIDAEEMTSGSFDKNQKIILFDDLNDALQFCEKILVAEKPSNLAFKRFEDLAGPSGEITSISLSTAFTHFIGVEPDHAKALEEYEKSKLSFHTETRYKLGETIFCSGTNADGFYIVLSGSVVILKDGNRSDNEIVSGAGKQHVITRRNIIESGQVSRILSVGSIFGFVDFVLQRPRTFSVVAGAENVLIAKCHRDGLDRLKADNPAMDRIVDKVLLLCSAVELASRDP